MNWYKAKTILIVFLAVVNIALFTYIIYDSIKSQQTEEMVLGTVTELLKEKGIKFDNEIINKTKTLKTEKSIYTKNVISSYNDFAKKMLGKNVKTLNENEYINETDTAKITFSGDRFHIEAKSGNTFMTTKSKDELKASQEILSGMGIDISDAKYTIEKNDKQTVIKFTEYINKYPVFGTDMTFIFTDGLITSISGCWFTRVDKEEQSTDLKNLSGVLIDYMNALAPISENITVSDISFGYSILETNQYHEEITLTPAWKISDTSGNEKYIDARETF